MAGPPHRHRVERSGQRPEPGLHRVDPLPSLAPHRSPFDPLRGRGEGIGRLADRGLEAGRQPVEVRRIRRIRLHRRAGVARELRELPARQLHAEEPGGDVGDLVRFVDDQGVGEREQLGEPLLLERHVGEQQMMVDHHHVRLGGTPARLRDVASVEHGTLRPEAVVRRRGDRAPDRIVLREVVHLREVAARRPGGPSREAGGPRGHAGRDEPAGGQHLFVAPAAEVVRAALEQRDARVASESAADERQIALEQLLLKMAGAGGDHDPAAAGDGGNEVREGLAGPGSGLADEDVPLRHGTLDRGGHGPLLGPGRVARQQPRQRTGRGEDTVAGSGGVHLPHPGTPPVNESGEVSGEAAIADTIMRARTRSPYRPGV